MCKYQAVDTSDLAGLSAVAGVPESDLERIAAAAEDRRFAAGTQILHRGDRSDPQFFLIVSGTAQIEVAEDLVIERGAGEFFGEVGALGNSPGYSTARTASVTAKTDLVAAVIPARRFSELVATIPQLRHTMYARLDDYAQSDHPV